MMDFNVTYRGITNRVRAASPAECVTRFIFDPKRKRFDRAEKVTLVVRAIGDYYPHAFEFFTR